MRQPGEISSTELVALGLDAGYRDFNERRLADSHRAGLMPAPRIDHPGGGGSTHRGYTRPIPGTEPLIRAALASAFASSRRRG